MNAPALRVTWSPNRANWLNTERKDMTLNQNRRPARYMLIAPHGLVGDTTVH